MHQPPPAALQALAIGRDADDDRTLFLFFNRAPSEDEMQAVHEHVKGLTLAAEDEPAGPQPFAPVDAYADTVEMKNHAAEAAMKCQEPAFKAFLEARHGLERPLTGERVAQKVRSLLGVTSRAELNRNAAAVDRWKRLRGEFETWRRVGR